MLLATVFFVLLSRAPPAVEAGAAELHPTVDLGWATYWGLHESAWDLNIFKRQVFPGRRILFGSGFHLSIVSGRTQK